MILSTCLYRSDTPSELPSNTFFFRVTFLASEDEVLEEVGVIRVAEIDRDSSYATVEI